MFAIIKNTAQRIPVFLESSATAGVGITGATYNTVTVYLIKQSTTPALKTLASSGDWFELSSGNTPGEYDMNLSTTDTNTDGFLRYEIAFAGAKTYRGCVLIVDGALSDIYNQEVTNGTAITAIKAKTDNLPAAPAAVSDVTSARDNVKAVLGTPTDAIGAGTIFAVIKAIPFQAFNGNGVPTHPKVTSVVAGSQTTLIVAFSANMKMDNSSNGALNLANYAVPGLTLSAVAQQFPNQVVLTTSTQIAGLTYNLSVGGVVDLNGNTVV